MTIRRIYWDACVFIKQLATKNKPEDKLILDGIDEVISDAEKGDAIIITSTISRIEVMECNITPGDISRYEKFLRRDIVDEYDVDVRIAQAAHRIRAHYRTLGHSLGVADSIHIATACLREAAELHTLEGTGKTPNMTALSGRIADQWDLKICQPQALMGQLFSIRPPEVAKEKDSPKQLPAKTTTKTTTKTTKDTE